METCKICNKKVRNLKLHNRYAHDVIKSKAKPIEKPAQDPDMAPVEKPLTKEELLTSSLDLPARPDYICGDCGCPIAYKQPACPKCGERLVWQAIGVK